MSRVIWHLKVIPVAASILLLWTAGSLFSHPILYTNFTHSMPLGVYLAIDRQARPGDDVVFASDLVPSCGLHLPPLLLKHFAYGAGVRVRIDQAGLHVAGNLVAPRVVHFGTVYSGTIPKGDSLLLGEDPRSFDSRYFGPVPVASLQPVEPLLTWSAR